MATYPAIATISKAILSLLQAARPPEFAATQFVLYKPADFQNPTTEERISLYLYRVNINRTQPNFRSRSALDGSYYNPPLPVDLHYLLTPWSQDAEKQQRMLGWLLRALEDQAILTSSLLNSFGPEPQIFRDDETVEIVGEMLSLQEIVNIWDAFKPNFQLSIAYVARMIPIETQAEQIEAAPVRTPIFEIGKGPL